MTLPALSDEMTSSVTGQFSSMSPVHISDSPNLQITTVKLDGTNYLLWAQSAKMFIGGRGKIGYITGSEQQPSESHVSYPQWFANDAMVRSWLVNSMLPHIAAGFIFSKTACQIWQSAKNIYSQHQDNLRIFNLGREIAQLKQDDLPVTEYIAKLRARWEELSFYDASLNWKDPVDAELYASVVEKNRVFQFLAGLRDEFEYARVHLLGMLPFPSLDTAYNFVRSDESRRGHASLLLKSDHSAMVVRASSSSKITPLSSQSRGNVPPQGYPQGRQRNKCDYCGKMGHIKARCFVLHGRPPMHNQATSRPSAHFAAPSNAHPESVTSGNVTLSQEEFDKFRQFFSQMETSSQPVATFATSSDSASAHHVSSASPPWIIDSGASDHMTGSGVEKDAWQWT